MQYLAGYRQTQSLSSCVLTQDMQHLTHIDISIILVEKNSNKLAICRLGTGETLLSRRIN